MCLWKIIQARTDNEAEVNHPNDQENVQDVILNLNPAMSVLLVRNVVPLLENLILKLYQELPYPLVLAWKQNIPIRKNRFNGDFAGYFYENNDIDKK